MKSINKEIFASPSSIFFTLWKHQFLRYMLIGSINTVVGYSIFAALIYAGMNYVPACLISTIMGALFNFKTTGKFVFASDNQALIWRFLLVYLVLYLVNIMLLAIGTMFISDIYQNGALCTVIMAIFSYTLNKYYVFWISDKRHRTAALQQSVR